MMIALALPGRGQTNDNIFTRQTLLTAMARNCIVPGMVEMAGSAEGLARAAQDLMNQPNPQTLAGAREAWTKMQLACSRNGMLAYGPVVDEVFWQANFYQMVHPGLTEYNITSGKPIDQHLIDRLGAAAKGFMTARYLLFAPVSTQTNKAGLDSMGGTNVFVSWLLQGRTAGRRREYLCAVTRDLSQHFQAVAQKAQAPGFVAGFAAGGQDSVNMLVNQIIAATETSLIMPLRLATSPLFTKRAGLTAEKLENMKALLGGLHRYYRGSGAGLDEYLRRINPGLNDRVEAQFKSATAALAVLDKPMETMDAQHRPQAEKALDEIHKLELLLKVDVVSAMGVTIMFHGYDGD